MNKTEKPAALRTLSDEALAAAEAAKPSNEHEVQEALERGKRERQKAQQTPPAIGVPPSVRFR